MAYVEMDLDLRQDPRVRSVALKTGATVSAVIGAFHHLWSMAYAHGTRTGADVEVSHYVPETYEKDVEIPGIAEAMRECGWLGTSPRGWCVAPRLGDRLTATEKERKTQWETERKRRQRAANKRGGTCPTLSHDERLGQNGTVPCKQSKAKQSKAAPNQSKALAAAVEPDAAAAQNAPLESSAALLLPEHHGLSETARLPENHGRLSNLRLMGFHGDILEALVVKPHLAPEWLAQLLVRGRAGKKRTGWYRNAIMGHLGQFSNGVHA